MPPLLPEWHLAAAHPALHGQAGMHVQAHDLHTCKAIINSWGNLVHTSLITLTNKCSKAFTAWMILPVRRGHRDAKANTYEA